MNWLALTEAAGGGLQGIGMGISAYEQAQQAERDRRLREKMFDWQQTMDKKGQFNTERQLGMNALTGMRSGFKDALYRSLTRS